MTAVTVAPEALGQPDGVTVDLLVGGESGMAGRAVDLARRHPYVVQSRPGTE